jgi:hypothetical protein
MLAWLVTALFAFNELTKRFGFDFYNLEFVKNSPHVTMALSWIVGVAGLVSLVKFVMWMTCSHHCHEGEMGGGMQGPRK